MEIFRVGGFVRDTLLGIEAKDIDYVVIGESPDSMMAKGFVRVGHFPVFLHPETQDEYALARSEVSTGKGHADFLYEWEGVTLEQDLLRRDLTINAMAMTHDGHLIDPYGGREDLKNGVLRHVSLSFMEDPLRILRVARFAARGFEVADETLSLMTKMVSEGMIDALTAERIWMETEKAMLSPLPERFFHVLDDCGALKVIFPELDSMKNVPQRSDFHAEGDVWVHTLMVLEEAAALSDKLSDQRKLRVRMGALLHDLGKINTPKDLLWNLDGSIKGHHHGHEDPERFSLALDTLASRIKMPNKILKFVHMCAQEHQNIHRIASMKQVGLVNLYNSLGLDRAVRNDPDFLHDVLTMCEADQYGRLITTENGSVIKPKSYSQKAYAMEAMAIIAAVQSGPIMKEAIEKGLTPIEAKGVLMGKRRYAAKNFIQNQTKGLEP